ncbi:alpha/beta fold hydrolase [Salinithrix halophila]|uniref:Alpha/beta fold hydrolase n=1 Tax=Salinithrix halophila TaxID=1485204 RepID=A0ABV8JH86_9BACL
MKTNMHDGSAIDVEIQGDGPTLLLPVNPHPVEGSQADEMIKWGADPALGRNLIEGLSDRFRVVAFDYEGHVLSVPKPDTLTPENIVSDLLAIADSAKAERFAYYGYSWLALTGMQLAIRTDRLSALIMGGYPPIDGPYAEMLRVTIAAHEMTGSGSTPQKENRQPSEEYDWSSVEVAMTENQTRQFVTLYSHLQDFDDRSAQEWIACPHLCFAGTADVIDYGERWGDARVDIAGPLVNRRTELESFGWDVHVFDGLDHTQSMQATPVLSVVRPWLSSKLIN